MMRKCKKFFKEWQHLEDILKQMRFSIFLTSSKLELWYSALIKKDFIQLILDLIILTKTSIYSTDLGIMISFMLKLLIIMEKKKSKLDQLING